MDAILLSFPQESSVGSSCNVNDWLSNGVSHSGNHTLLCRRETLPLGWSWEAQREDPVSGFSGKGQLVLLPDHDLSQ